MIKDYMEYLYFLLANGSPGPVSVNMTPPDVLKDHILLASYALTGIKGSNKWARTIEAELGMRIARATFANGPKNPRSIWTQLYSPLTLAYSIRPEIPLGQYVSCLMRSSLSCFYV